ncbi:MAG: tRNA lysidine(34) synthetase TilS [Flavobacteriales bacterium]|nr:tRNA lysidine(34) synthetase TilS [Flavobacteriales bacterium]
MSSKGRSNEGGFEMNLARSVKSFIKRNELCSGQDKILLTISGGMDSMVMLDIFLELGYPIAIAHCNFSLRNEESDLDEELVVQIAQEKGIVIHRKNFNTKIYSKEKKLSVQEAARELRYSWFQELATEYSYTKIATAHHFDDNIETVLINLQRSSGLKGLRGILPIRGNIIRPLLDLTKDEISEYAEERGISFREDRSNTDTKYLRNKIRHQAIPVLKKKDKEFYSNWKQRINENRKNWELLQSKVAEAKILCIEEKKDGQLLIDIDELQDQEGSELILFHLLDGLGFSSKQRANAIDLLKASTGKKITGDTHELIKDRNKLVLAPLADQSFNVEIIEGQFSVNGPLDLEIVEISKSTMAKQKSANIAYFDAAKLSFPLKVRNWQEGDKFFPFGMKGQKKVSDLLIDNKVNIHEKKLIPIMTSGDEIIWVMGLRSSDKFKVTEETKEVLKIEWLKDE